MKVKKQELIPGRRESRKRVIAAGLTDEDIDRLIEETRQEVYDEMRRETDSPSYKHNLP